MRIQAAVSPARLVRRVFLIALGCEAALLLLDLLVARTGVLGFAPLAGVFDITSEGSLGNFFSSLQALGVGLVLWLVRCRVKLEGREARWRRRGWGALALFFLFLGVDDGVMLHERLGSFATHLGGASFHRIESSFGSYTWQLVLGPLFVLAGLFMLVFLWRELARQGRVFLLLAIACYTVAVGLDHLEGRSGSLTPLVPLLGLNIDAVAHLVRALEEMLEMIGTTLFLCAFLDRLLAGLERVELDLGSGAANFATPGDDCRRPEP